MRVTRRKLALAVGSGVILSGIGLQATADQRYQFRRGGSVGTEEPLLKGVDIPADSGYPHEYHGLIRSPSEVKRLRWEYFEANAPPYAEQFRNADLGDGFLVVVGLVLPATKQLESGPVRFDGGEMVTTYRVLDRISASETVAVHSVVEYWVGDAEPPAELTVQYRYE